MRLPSEPLQFFDITFNIFPNGTPERRLLLRNYLFNCYTNQLGTIYPRYVFATNHFKSLQNTHNNPRNQCYYALTLHINHELFIDETWYNYSARRFCPQERRWRRQRDIVFCRRADIHCWGRGIDLRWIFPDQGHAWVRYSYIHSFHPWLLPW